MVEDVTLRIDRGSAISGSDFEVTLPRVDVAEVVRNLRHAGIEAEEPLVHAAPADRLGRISVIVRDAGGLASLAMVLATVFGRHRDKRLVVNSESIEITGYSAQDAAVLLRALATGDHTEDGPARSSSQ